MTVLVWILVVILVVTGFLGILFPVLPGVSFILFGLVLASWHDGFAHIGWPTVVTLTMLAIAAEVIGFIAQTLYPKRLGASPLAVMGAALGTVFGIFLGLPGLVFGPFAFAFAGEFIARRDLMQASRIGMGTLAGLVAGTAAKVAIAFTMIGVFVTSWLF